MISRTHILLFSAVLLAGVCVAAATQSPGQTAQPRTPAVPTVTGEPAWFSSQDIGEGVELETWVGLAPAVINPTTSTSVRPVSLHLNFLYGLGVMQQIDVLKLYDVSDTNPKVFNMAGIDRQVVAPQRPPHKVLKYLVTIQPKANYTWGTIRGALDLNIDAVQQ